MLNSSNNPPQQQDRLQPLRQLLYEHGFAFCCGLWAVLVIGGSMATLRLLNPGSMEKQASNPTPALTTFQETTKSKSKKELPLSLFVTVILGCAAGSLAVTQTLKYSIRRQSRKTMKSSRTIGKKRRHSSQKPPIESRASQPVSSALTYQPREKQVPTINSQMAQVTVLPPEESHPLDGGNENLAELMDLRKRHSLASLMRGK
jgi:hypothetical protein